MNTDLIQYKYIKYKIKYLLYSGNIKYLLYGGNPIDKILNKKILTINDLPKITLKDVKDEKTFIKFLLYLYISTKLDNKTEKFRSVNHELEDYFEAILSSLDTNNINDIKKIKNSWNRIATILWLGKIYE